MGREMRSRKPVEELTGGGSGKGTLLPPNQEQGTVPGCKMQRSVSVVGR